MTRPRTTDVIESIAALGDRLATLPRPLGFVPTMGALHAGHGRLIEQAKSENQTVVVSIFVNPLQFDRSEDLRKYPASLDRDVALCGEHGVDIVFAPTAAAMYPEPQVCTIDVGRLADHLCGPFRPKHFEGMATVVMKLLQIVQPDAAYFGEKDAQQLAIVKRLVADFAVPCRIVGVPTVRDADGLALSSRNARLSADERALAPSLYRALRAAGDAIRAGVVDPTEVVAAAERHIPTRPDVRLEYLEVVDPWTLAPVEKISGEVFVAGAMWVGATRLIDNLKCESGH